LRGRLKVGLRKRFWHKTVVALFTPALFLLVGHASAASLAKIEVASHLGEPFYAEVPVKLEPGESVSRVHIKIASPADYKIFEVYRDPVLKDIRADVASDERGVRVELSSSSRIKAPFFNLILKIHSGRVSRFKKIPVFLDVKKSVLQAAGQKPQPSVQAVKTAAAEERSGSGVSDSAGQVVYSGNVSVPVAKAIANTAEHTRAHFSGWARTSRYGPIVRGDSLSTVAKRLMIDNRYTLSQVRLALFEKNRSSFAQDNMNLLKKNSFLDVPTADEVEQHSPAEASRVFLEHEKKWHKLIQQPRFAAEAEAQRTRYTRHISVGEHAAGVAAAPVIVRETTAAAKSKPSLQPTDVVPPSDSARKVSDSVVSEQQAEVAQAQDESSQVVARLQGENRILRQQLAANQKNIEVLSNRVDDIAAAATNARIDKLEILINRLQAELEKSHAQRPASLFDGLDWMIWLLIGLLVVLLGIVAVLLRREPVHPAASPEGESGQAASLVTAGESKALAKTGSGGESSGETAVMDPLSASGSEFGNVDSTGSIAVEENPGNLPIQDFDAPALADIDFDSSNSDASDVGTGQDDNIQSPFDTQDFNEPETINWRHHASFDDESIDPLTAGQDEAVVASDRDESNEMAGFAAGTTQETDSLGFMDHGDETTVTADDEEPIRHLDSLLSKFDDDDDPLIIDDENTRLEKSFFESSDVEDVSKPGDEFVIDDDSEQVETRDAAPQSDEFNDDGDHRKD